MTNILEKFHSQMDYDSQKIQQAIANYESFLFWCTEIRGMTIDEANYCWRHKNMNKKRFSQKDEDDWEILDRNKHFAYAHSGYQAKKIIQELNELVETNRELYKENKQLKQSIKEIDEAELHLKQIILKRIDDYIWEWEDEGTPVAQVLRELRDEIKGDVE